jgi:hypothetical protein
MFSIPPMTRRCATPILANEVWFKLYWPDIGISRPFHLVQEPSKPAMSVDQACRRNLPVVPEIKGGFTLVNSGREDGEAVLLVFPKGANLGDSIKAPTRAHGRQFTATQQNARKGGKADC